MANTKFIKSFAGALKDISLKKAPEILTGIGIAGFITATVLGIKATPKALTLIEAKKKELGKEKLKFSETVDAAWKCYIPSAAVTAVSATAIVGASSVNHQRNVALATAYSLSESAFKDYQEKVIEKCGEETHKEISKEVSPEKENVNLLMCASSEDYPCFDSISKRPFRSSVNKLESIANELNARIVEGDTVTLNDYYYEIGLDNTDDGELRIWTQDYNGVSNLIDLDIRGRVNENGVPYIYVGHHHMPKYLHER